VQLAPIAYCASLIEAAEHMLDDPAGTTGGDGYFNMLDTTFGAAAFGVQGSRLAQFVNGKSPSAVHFAEAWEDLRVASMGTRGLLCDDAAEAGKKRSKTESLQHQLTEQIEEMQRDALHARIMLLPRTDTRRMAWLSCDSYSSEWVASWPKASTPGKAALNLDGFGGLEFGEVFSTYLGRESPAIRNAVRRVLQTRQNEQSVTVPDSHAARRGRPPECDLYGMALGSATLLGGSVTVCHDGCADALFTIVEAAGIRMEREPKLFTSLIPVGGLMGPQPPQSIRPDAYIDVAMPPANPPRSTEGRRPKPGKPAAVQRNLFDVKTIYGGTRHYSTGHAATAQCAAVDTRAQIVDADYRQHARKIDTYSYRCAMCPRQRTADRCAMCSANTPISDALATHGVVRGAVFGQYGEASIDVHSLVDIASRTLANKKWRTSGARSCDEAYAFFVAANRRALGVAVVREFARHRLRRLAFIGASMEQVREARDVARTPSPSRDALSPEEADIFHFLQGRGARGGD